MTPPANVQRPPGYWRDETSARVRPAVEAYLHGERLTMFQLAAMRAYLKQWIDSDVWDLNPHADKASKAELAALRHDAALLYTQRGSTEWIARAMDLGMDPL